VYACGKGNHGRLGLGDENGRLQPTLLRAFQGVRVKQVSAGCRHAAAISEEGKLYTWGFNFYEQLGLGEVEKDIKSPTEVPGLEQVLQVSCGYFHTGAMVASGD